MFQESKLPRVFNDNLNLVTMRNSPSGGRSTPHLYDAQASLESRVQLQENATLDIMDRLSNFQREMMDQLAYTKQVKENSQVQENRLEQELKALALIVARMKNDVETFESDIREKWKAINSAAIAFKQLEDSQVSNFTDLSNRASRNDRSIATLDDRTTQLREEMRAFTEQYKRDMTELQRESSLLIQKHSLAANEFDKHLELCQSRMRSVKEDLHNQLLEVEKRLVTQQIEIRHEAREACAKCLAEISRQEKMLPGLLHALSDQLEKKINEMEMEIADDRANISTRLDEIENELSSFKKQVTVTFKDVEQRLEKLHYQCEKQDTFTDTIREELRQGLATTHSTMVDMKSLLEDKIRVTAENLQLEMSSLRNLIVLT